MTNDYSSIDIIDPITQQKLTNLSQLVESTSQLEAIHIQSPMFDARVYLTTVHADTDSSTFHSGIQAVKKRLNSST